MNGYFVAAQQVQPFFQKYGPVGVLGKLVGLGDAEIESGVPWWAWLGTGVVVGGVVAYAARDRLERVFD